MTSKHRILLLMIVLCLLFWASHNLAINAFPPFIDETIHIFTTEKIPTTNILFNAHISRQLTIWWYFLFAPTSSSDPIWVSRIATLFITTIGFAAVVATGRLIGSLGGMGIAGFLLIFSIYHYFFGRLALADPLSSSLVLVAVHFAYRLKHRYIYTDAILCGFFLFLAFIAKTNALPYFVLPILAGMFLWESHRPLVKNLKWVAISLGVGLGLSAIFIIVLRLRGYDYLFSSFAFAVGGRYTTTASQAVQLFNIPQILEHLLIRVGMIVAYSGLPYLILAIGSLFFSLWKRQFFLLAVLAIPSSILVISGVQETRYWYAPLATLIMLIMFVLNDLATRHKFIERFFFPIIIVFGLVVALPFWLTGTQSPLNMPLDEFDKREYVNSDAAGSALDEVIAILESRNPIRVIGALANCDGFRYRAWQKLLVECLRMRATGEDATAIAVYANAFDNKDTYIVLETSPYAPAIVNGTIIAIVERPTGLATLTIYQLSK